MGLGLGNPRSRDKSECDPDAQGDPSRKPALLSRCNHLCGCTLATDDPYVFVLAIPLGGETLSPLSPTRQEA